MVHPLENIDSHANIWEFGAEWDVHPKYGTGRFEQHIAHINVLSIHGKISCHAEGIKREQCWERLNTVPDLIFRHH